MSSGSLPLYWNLPNPTAFLGQEEHHLTHLVNGGPALQCCSSHSIQTPRRKMFLDMLQCSRVERTVGASGEGQAVKVSKQPVLSSQGPVHSGTALETGLT